MTKPNKTPKQLADEHWTWLESVLDQQRRMEKKLFIDGMVHGYKHGYKQGVEDSNAGIVS